MLPKIGAPLNCDPTPMLQWVEVSSSFQIPHFQIVGLPSPEVSEAKERVKAAIETSELPFPKKRIVVNLSPANIRKQGTNADLAIALSVLLTKKPNLSPELEHTKWVACGELGLDGNVKPVGQITRAIYACTKERVDFLLLPVSEKIQAYESLKVIKESCVFKNKPPVILLIENLSEAWKILSEFSAEQCNQYELKYDRAEKDQTVITDEELTLLPISPSLERVLCASTAGEHHLLLLGPKGVGKSHAIEWLSVLHEAPLPKDKLNQILLAELNLSSKNKDIYSAIRKISVHVRPAALIGSTSGTILRVGEFSLAHGGLLIADEILEWHRDSREALREPLEQGVVTLTRKQGTVELPARFTLVASGNLCPCGGWPKSIPLSYTSTTLKSMKIKLCHCPTHHMERYFKKLSGPILDRIDIVLKVTGTLGEFNVLPSGKINQLKDKINKVKSRLINQYGAPPGQLKPYELEKFFEKNPTWKNESIFLDAESLRSRHKILRLALTLAAWDDKSYPNITHIHEASLYRPERLGF